MVMVKKKELKPKAKKHVAELNKLVESDGDLMSHGIYQKFLRTMDDKDKKEYGK